VHRLGGILVFSWCHHLQHKWVPDTMRPALHTLWRLPANARTLVPCGHCVRDPASLTGTTRVARRTTNTPQMMRPARLPPTAQAPALVSTVVLVLMLVLVLVLMLVLRVPVSLGMRCGAPVTMPARMCSSARGETRSRPFAMPCSHAHNSVPSKRAVVLTRALTLTLPLTRTLTPRTYPSRTTVQGVRIVHETGGVCAHQGEPQRVGGGRCTRQ